MQALFFTYSLTMDFARLRREVEDIVTTTMAADSTTADEGTTVAETMGQKIKDKGMELLTQLSEKSHSESHCLFNLLDYPIGLCAGSWSQGPSFGL